MQSDVQDFYCSVFMQKFSWGLKHGSWQCAYCCKVHYADTTGDSVFSLTTDDLFDDCVSPVDWRRHFALLECEIFASTSPVGLHAIQLRLITNTQNLHDTISKTRLREFRDTTGLGELLYSSYSRLYANMASVIFKALQESKGTVT